MRSFVGHLCNKFDEGNKKVAVHKVQSCFIGSEKSKNRHIVYCAIHDNAAIHDNVAIHDNTFLT